MKDFRPLLLALCLAMPLWAMAQNDQDTYLDPSLPEGVSVRQIISKFAAQEEIYKQAREHYTYREKVRVQTLNDQDYPDGEYDNTFDVTFDDQGQRVIHEVSAPRDTLKTIRMTPEDVDDIRNRLPFILTTDEIPEYNIQYKGRQQTQGVPCYVFDISPKAMAEGQRYFEGRIWVDASGFQIVKSAGKAVPDIYNKQGENLFPSFTTYRQLVDGKYWFPAYTKSDDYLHFSSGSVHVIETVDYTNYKRFGAESRIIFDGQELPQGGQAGAPAPTQTQQPPAPVPRQNAPAYPPASQGQTTAPRPVTNPPAQASQLAQQELVSVEREFSDAVTHRDVSILERLLTDDFQLISANGDKEDKFGLLDDIHQDHAGTFGQPQNLQVQVNGDRATVSGIREESVPAGAHKVQTAKVRFADQYVRRAGEWLLAQSKESAAR